MLWWNPTIWYTFCRGGQRILLATFGECFFFCQYRWLFLLLRSIESSSFLKEISITFGFSKAGRMIISHKWSPMGLKWVQTIELTFSFFGGEGVGVKKKLSITCKLMTKYLKYFVIFALLCSTLHVITFAFLGLSTLSIKTKKLDNFKSYCKDS